MTPDVIVASFRDVIAQSRPVIMAGVGSGLTAAGAARGGAHLIAAYSTAVYRCRGLPSVLSFLPYDNANDLAFSVAADVIAQAGDCPVILGLGVHDPRADLDGLLDRVEELGAVGIMNEPFVGMYSAEIRAELDEVGFGFRREVALIERTAARNLLAYAWAFSPDEAREMVGSGARVVGAMLGPSKDDDSALERILADADAIAEAALAADPAAIVLAHGGPLTTPKAVREFLLRSACHGYATGSSAERRPVIEAVAQVVGQFGAPLREYR